jgi:hypothetical protein
MASLYICETAIWDPASRRTGEDARPTRSLRLLQRADVLND